MAERLTARRSENECASRESSWHRETNRANWSYSRRIIPVKFDTKLNNDCDLHFIISPPESAEWEFQLIHFSYTIKRRYRNFSISRRLIFRNVVTTSSTGQGTFGELCSSKPNLDQSPSKKEWVRTRLDRRASNFSRVSGLGERFSRVRAYPDSEWTRRRGLESHALEWTAPCSLFISQFSLPFFLSIPRSLSLSLFAYHSSLLARAHVDTLRAHCLIGRSYEHTAVHRNIHVRHVRVHNASSHSVGGGGFFARLNTRACARCRNARWMRYNIRGGLPF